MHPLAPILNTVLASLSVLSLVLSAAIASALLFPKLREASFARFFGERAILVSFVATLVATIGSLLYSDVIGYEPCKLCWFQRIFMYPQLFIYGLALVRKEAFVKPYGILLSLLGAAVAIFHYIGQLGVNPLGLDCLAVGYSASCAQNFVLTFGFVTIPFMALSAFVLIALSLTLSLSRTREVPDATLR